jgi:8-hydroxy-5-deazaflavin:NADPH oxidoreductase
MTRRSQPCSSSEAGFEAIDAGKLAVARLLEPFGMLWIHLAYAQGMGRDFAFGLLRRGSPLA